MKKKFVKLSTFLLLVTTSFSMCSKSDTTSSSNTNSYVEPVLKADSTWATLEPAPNTLYPVFLNSLDKTRDTKRKWIATKNALGVWSKDSTGNTAKNWLYMQFDNYNDNTKYIGTKLNPGGYETFWFKLTGVPNTPSLKDKIYLDSHLSGSGQFGIWNASKSPYDANMAGDITNGGSYINITNVELIYSGTVYNTYSISGNGIIYVTYYNPNTSMLITNTLDVLQLKFNKIAVSYKK